MTTSVRTTRPGVRLRPRPAPPPDDDRRWDRIVAAMPDATVYQTSGWAAAKGTGVTCRRIVLDPVGRDSGHPDPGGPDPGGPDRSGQPGEPVGPPRARACAQLLVRAFGPLTRVGYVPYGPLLADPGADSGWADRHRAVDLVEEAARDAGCVAVLVQPSRRDDATVGVLEERGYRRAPVEVATTAAIEVELGRSDDELLAAMAKYRRRNVRRARRRGVVVEEGTRADLVVLERLHRSSAGRHGFTAMSLDYLERQWDALHPSGHLHLLQARLGDRVVASGIMLGYRRWAEFKLTGWDGSAEARAAFANEAVNWAMMSRANRAGHLVFDLGGLPRGDAAAVLESGDEDLLRTSGSQFKRGWGGTVRVYPATYEKVLRPIGRLTYSLPSRLLDDHGPGGRLVNLVRRS